MIRVEQDDDVSARDRETNDKGNDLLMSTLDVTDFDELWLNAWYHSLTSSCRARVGKLDLTGVGLEAILNQSDQIKCDNTPTF